MNMKRWIHIHSYPHEQYRNLEVKTKIIRLTFVYWTLSSWKFCSMRATSIDCRAYGWIVRSAKLSSCLTSKYFVCCILPLCFVLCTMIFCSYGKKIIIVFDENHYIDRSTGISDINNVFEFKNIWILKRNGFLIWLKIKFIVVFCILKNNHHHNNKSNFQNTEMTN